MYCAQRACPAVSFKLAQGSALPHRWVRVHLISSLRGFVAKRLQRGMRAQPGPVAVTVAGAGQGFDLGIECGSMSRCSTTLRRRASSQPNFRGCAGSNPPAQASCRTPAGGPAPRASGPHGASAGTACIGYGAVTRCMLSIAGWNFEIRQ